MCKFNESLSICFCLHRKWTQSPRVWMSFLIGIIFSIVLSSNYSQYAFTIQAPINFLEPYLLISNDIYSLIFILLGFILLLSDAPFIDNSSLYSIIRSSRQAWVSGVIIYIVFSAILYWGIVCLTSIFTSIGQIYLNNVWSNAFYSLSAYRPIVFLSEFGLNVFDVSILQGFETPANAFVHSIFLNILYAIFLGLIMFVGNMNSIHPIGTLTALGVHGIGYLVLLEADYIGVYFSLLAHSIATIHYDGSYYKVPTLFESYMLLICILGFLTIIASILAQKCDFRSAAQKEY